MPLGTETVVVLRETSGKPVGGIAPVVTIRVVIEGCDVDVVGTEETLGSDNPVTDRYRVITATGDIREDVEEHDRVEWRGKTWEVLGEPGHLYGVLPHSEFVIARVKG